MKRAFRWLVLILLLFTLGCNQASVVTPGPGLNPSATPGSLQSIDVRGVETAARSFLDAWKTEDYPAMYAQLTSVSQAALSLEEFVKHFEGVAKEASLSGIDYEILSSLTNPDSAQVSYRVVLHSVRVGDVQGQTLMNLSLEGGQWRVQWDDTLVLPDLKGGNYLWMDRDGFTPARANIYDRNGHALVAQADASAVGFRPDEIDPQQAEEIIAQLASLTGQRVDTIQYQYQNASPGQYIPLGEVPASEVERRYPVLASYGGVYVNAYKARYYFQGGVAPHVVGYVGLIGEDEVDEYRRKGYTQDERVGKAGLEKWGEAYLSGKRGGRLWVINAQGLPVRELVESPAETSQAIFTTLDRDFQVGVQESLSSFRGAAVVLERDTGRVLALASSPGFDPNAFEAVLNFNSYTQVSDILNDPRQPLLNRATMGQYPLGSVFKIITMAAGLESGHFTPQSTYECGYHFTELEGAVLNDWTWEHNQNSPTAPSGLLTLPQGLVRSCNPWFWHIGLSLYSQGIKTAVADMARGFGLGSLTGIKGVDEAAGSIPDPQSPVDAVNQAIGQGDVLVTPLQVARFAAAIGNGGTLYRPQIIERISPPDGDPTFEFQPDPQEELPLSAESLQVIQEALVGVVRSTQPYGTAWHRFTGLDYNVAGKTGTAQSGFGAPHAWFAGYTFEEREDRPDIAIAVIIENIGEGSDYAAPIFRRIVELYFGGQPAYVYPWESTYGVTQTPTSPVEGTPAPEESQGSDAPATVQP